MKFNKSKIFLPSTILKTASIISLVWAAGHTYGTLSILTGEAASSIQAQTIQVNGVAKTFADLFGGYGYFITVFMLIQAAILWQLSTRVRNGETVNQTVMVFLISSIATSVLSKLYLISIPMIFSMVIAVLLFLVLIAGRTERSALS